MYIFYCALRCCSSSRHLLQSLTCTFATVPYVVAAAPDICCSADQSLKPSSKPSKHPHICLQACNHHAVKWSFVLHDLLGWSQNDDVILVTVWRAWFVKMQPYYARICKVVLRQSRIKFRSRLLIVNLHVNCTCYLTCDVNHLPGERGKVEVAIGVLWVVFGCQL